MSAIIITQLFLVVVALVYDNRTYRIFLGSISVLFAIPVYFCFRHEMQLYISGTILLASVMTGVFVAIRPWRM
jgi:hypothetical protein